jgi:hypothetical protein
VDRAPSIAQAVRSRLLRLDDGFCSGMIRTMRPWPSRAVGAAAVWALATASVIAQVMTPEPSIPPKASRPPRFVVQASPEVLWPADGRYVEITVKVIVTDGNDPPSRVRLAAITCNQKFELGVDVRDAAFGTDDRVFLLKATSSLANRDRIYRAIYHLLDAAGNRSNATARVVVSRHSPATPASRP